MSSQLLASVARRQLPRLLLAVQGWLVATSGYLLAMTAVAWRARSAAGAETSQGEAVHRFAILVPAHDEEALIGLTVRSMVELDYPSHLFSVHVVADNCQDRTAAVARAAGATVHERVDADKPGKGPALEWLLGRLGAGEDDHDAYVVVDADSVLNRPFLRVMDARLSAGERVIQAHYTVRDPDTSWAVGLRYAALAVRHYLRPLARTRLGASAGLFGNGMVFRSDVLRDRGFSDHLTEDIELHMELLLAGERVSFAPDAVVAAEMPDTLAAARSQNERWERGRLEMARTYIPRLLRRPAVARRGQRLAQLDAVADHLVAPFSVMVGATAGAGVAAHVLRRLVPTPVTRVNAAVGVGLVAAQAMYVLSGLRLVKAPLSVYRSLVYAPLMVLWKLPLLFRVAVSHRDVEWVRTARNDQLVREPDEHIPESSPLGRTGPLAVVLGVPVEDVTLDEAATRCCELVELGRATGRTHQVTTVNVDFVLTARHDPAVLKILQWADLAIPDGMPIVWGSRLLGTPLRQRVAGADLVPALAACAAQRSYSMYLFGSAPGVAEEAARILSERYPGAKIVGSGGPVFTGVEDMDVEALDDIIAEKPDILCVALGHPKQERWIEAYRDKIGVPVMVGVGGSLDFLVGTKRRAPEWMQRTGLEWLHRLLTEPSRLAGRYARDLLHFPPRLLWEVATTASRRERTAETSGWLERRCKTAVMRLEAGLDIFSQDIPPEVQAVIDDRKRMIVDLSPVARLDRVTLASLIVLARRAHAGGGEIVLVGLSPRALRTVRGLRLEGYFGVTTDDDVTVVAEGTAPVVMEVSRRREGDQQQWGFRFTAIRRPDASRGGRSRTHP